MNTDLNQPISEIHLQQGLVGLNDLKRFAVVREPEQDPFLRLCSLDDQDIEFIAIEPRKFVGNYAFILSDPEAEELQIKDSPNDSLVLNLVTVHKEPTSHLTVNLLAPLVVNRTTGEARQVVLADSNRFSTNFRLGGTE